MEARILISALHFNENSNRAQAVTEKGDACWGVSYPKSRKGEPVVKAVKVGLTYEYVNQLLEAVFDIRSEFPSYNKANKALDQSAVPAHIATKHERKDKQKLVQDHKKRFN